MKSLPPASAKPLESETLPMTARSTKFNSQMAGYASFSATPPSNSAGRMKAARSMSSRSRLDVGHVTNHAILRYQQRVEMVSMEQAKAALQSEAIQHAAVSWSGVHYVTLPTGHQVVVKCGRVITVLPRLGEVRV